MSVYLLYIPIPSRVCITHMFQYTHKLSLSYMQNINIYINTCSTHKAYKHAPMKTNEYIYTHTHPKIPYMHHIHIYHICTSTTIHNHMYIWHTYVPTHHIYLCIHRHKQTTYTHVHTNIHIHIHFPPPILHSFFFIQNLLEFFLDFVYSN